MYHISTYRLCGLVVNDTISAKVMSFLKAEDGYPYFSAASFVEPEKRMPLHVTKMGIALAHCQ